MKAKVFLMPPPTLHELKKQQQRAEIEQAEHEYKLSRREKGYTVHSKMKE
jgi:hypothetical protein